MAFTYTANVPLTNQRIQDTTTIINDNFQALGTYLANDHIDITDATVAKRITHKQVTLNTLGAGPVTSADQMALYCKLVNAIPELFYRRASSGTEVQLTVANQNPIKATSNNQSFLPGGIVMKWGVSTFVAGQANNNVTFTNPFPTACRSVVCTFIGNNATIWTQNYTVNGFQAVRSAAGTAPSYSWIALGD